MCLSYFCAECFIGGSAAAPPAAAVDYSSHMPRGCFYGQEVKQRMEEATTGTELCLTCLCFNASEEL